MKTKFHRTTLAGRLLFLFGVILTLAGCTNEPAETTPQPPVAEKPKTEVKNLVDSELLILELTKDLKKLNRDARNMGVPGVYSQSLFADEIQFNEVTSNSLTEEQLDYISQSAGEPESTLQTIARDQFQLWSELFENTSYFELAKFYFVSGEYDSTEKLKFHSNMGFKALARTKENGWRSVRAKLKVDWVRDSDSDPALRDSWKIGKLKTANWKSQTVPELMFADCLDEMCGRELADKMQYSKHFEYMAELVSTGTSKMERQYAIYFSPGQTVQHPGVSAIDINKDGWEDLYICDEWLENKLLINLEGKGFREAAAEYNLDIPRTATSAIFADFDNDGDLDAFIGRCYELSMLLINRNGIFVDVTKENLHAELPHLVTSVSATDFNNDGLIDLYLSTYGYASGNQRFKNWTNDYLTTTDRERHSRLVGKQHRFLSAFGPSNLLLQNLGGGKFAYASENEYIDHNHNTFQSVWVDYDRDGDQDLYVSNDYAQDFLYRNDRGSFKDVTFEVGGEAMLGFGMGAGWGDFDADGDFDLYVSNMYSKAGNRILDQIPDIDQRFHLTANGNRLYQQQEGKLVCLPGTDDHAAKAGWSWGGKFTDFDNDGWLDIYVGSGYLTSPFDDENIEDL